MSVVTETVVLIAATIYIWKYTSELIAQIAKDTVRRYGTELSELHDAAFKDVETPFEFWWTGEPSRIVRRAALTKLPLPEELRASMPDQMLEALLEPFTDAYREAALHLAVHARMRANEDKLIRKLPKWFGLREFMLKHRMDHEKELEGEREQLVSVGIDVDQLEADFSSSQ